MQIFLFIIPLTIFALLNLYILKRLINKLDIKQVYKKYFKIFLWINYLGILGYIYSRHNSEIPDLLLLFLSFPLGIIFLTFCTAIFYDISHMIIQKVPLSENRRAFFKKGLDYTSVALALGISAKAIYEAKFIEIETVDIKIKNLKKEYTVVQISDVHIGGIIDKKFVKDMVERINDLKPDMVVITGDLVDIKLEYAMPALYELKKLFSKYGTYFIVGNHEYIHGVEKIIQTVNSLGIKTLENENIYIGEKNIGFNLAGVYDIMGNRINHHKPNLNKALKNKSDNSPTVLLAHQPVYIEEVKNSVELVLSGHTHGGQLYPFRALVKLVQPYISGLHQHNKETQIYVNKGTGFWGPPMRLGASSEITYIKLS